MRNKNELSSFHIEDFLPKRSKESEAELNKKCQAVSDKALPIMNRLSTESMKKSGKKFDGQSVISLNAFINNFLIHELNSHLENDEQGKVYEFEDFLEGVEKWLDYIES